MSPSLSSNIGNNSIASAGSGIAELSVGKNASGGGMRPKSRSISSEALRLMHRAALPRELAERFARNRVVAADLQHHGPASATVMEDALSSYQRRG
jgi:hypothetical protein